mgnify:CR=1 FL=1
MTVVVRPEKMRLTLVGDGSAATIDGRLADAVYLGSFIKYVVTLNNGQRATLHNSDIAGRRTIAVGEPVKVGWSSADQRVLEE